ERVSQEGLRPSPEMFELWYRYYDGDPEICSAIDRHEEAIDEAFCMEVHKKFIARVSVDDAMRKINDNLQKALMEVSEAVGGMQDATTDYSSSLADMTGHMKE